MRVENVNIFGLDESVRGAKFPMSVDTDQIISAEELSYWMSCDFLARLIKHMDSGEYPKYHIADDHVEMTLKKKSGEETVVLIDEEDLPAVFNYNWNFHEYCKSMEVGLLHRFIMQDYLRGDNDAVVDHINHDTRDNRKCNLRLASRSNNSYNAITRKSNRSGVMGVSWKADKGKWKAYINNYGKQIHLGYYDKFEDAVEARLKKEAELCGEFAPQKFLFPEYGIDEPPENATKQKTYCRLNDAIAAYKNISRLGLANPGEGHDQALTGIIVQFDLTCSNKMWVEMERYHFIDFVSSQSTMHRIAKMDFVKCFNRYVTARTVIECNRLKAAYQEDPTPENYLKLLYNIPSGMELTARMTTNYRQLKTIYRQRKDHRLPEWREFCRWLETLPHSEWITRKEN